MKTIQQADYTLKSEKAPYWVENDGKVNSEVGDQNYGLKEMEGTEPESLSEASKSPLMASKRSEQYNLLSNQKKAQNEQIFVTLGKISEHERVEIIEKGFQLQAEGKISLKKYY